MRFFYLFFLCVIFYGPVFSQSANEKQIDVNFQHATMGQVASDIESKTNYHFYYNPADVDSLRITLQATQKSVSYILEQALKGTRCYYAISGREIFITKGREIKTELSEGFFSNEKPVAAKQEAVESFVLTDTKKVVEATAENKVYQIG